jgi:simple sugar transport system ATP-binding protein
MRQGAMVKTLTTAETSPPELAELMVGRRVLLRVEKGPARPGKVMLEVEHLVVADDFKIPRVKDVSFSVRAGEIVGIAGVAGNGQSELLESISGMRDQQSGVIRLNGTPLSLEGDDGAARARDAGLAHVPEDRLRMGLIASFAEWENAILGYHNRYGRGLTLDIGKAKQDADAYIGKFDIRPPSIELKTANFSGGNQQKIVLAREMERDPDVLIVGQPTRGVDIGAIEFIHNQIIKMRDAGKAILLVSVELDEIRSLSDRILVLFDGKIVGEADPAVATEGELGLLMAGVHAGNAPAAGPGSLPAHETPVEKTLVERGTATSLKDTQQ